MRLSFFARLLGFQEAILRLRVVVVLLVPVDWLIVAPWRVGLRGNLTFCFLPLVVGCLIEPRTIGLLCVMNFIYLGKLTT